MKPTFALDLTRDLIALLHRTPKGWLSIGEVAFDAPDLDEALDYLRKTALGLSPMGMATKIILPASQILYTEIHAPGPSRDDKRRQIAAGLEGRTPYAVEDLVFDWSGKGATVKVAVVARETLDEAEGFAVTHRLNPVSFVAIPEEGSFVGEPWFGPTAAAATIIAAGETVERDRDAVTILQRELPATTKAPAVPAPEAEPEAAVAVANPDAEDPLPGLEEALNADLPVGSDEAPSEAALTPEVTAPSLADQADAPKANQPPVNQTPVEDDNTLDESLSAALADALADEAPAPDRVAAPKVPDDAVAFPDPVAPEADAPKSENKGSAQPPAPPAETASPKPTAEVEEAPFAHVTDTAAFPDGDDDLPRPLAARGAVPETQADTQADDIPPAPPSAAMVAFASRRSATPAGTARPVEGAVRPDAASAPTGGARLGAPASRIPPAKGFAGLVTAPSIPGTRARPKVKPPVSDAAKSPAEAPGTVRSPARPGGTFGTAAPPRGRSGVVFMVLVALLLLCLALIAAWSSLYLARNSGDTPLPTEVVLDVVPGVEDEMLADMQDPEGLTDPIPEADGPPLAGGDAGALATESVDMASVQAEAPANDLAGDATADAPLGSLEETAADLAEATVPADEAAPETAPDTAIETAADIALADVAVPVEPAPGTTVATDLAVAAPPVEDQDEIFLSAMDAPPPALDALALPTPAATRDTVPDAPMPPPAFGTVYQFDALGLLKPTPEGILSPDGVMLIAGKPPLVPPARTEVAATAAALAAAVAAPVETAPSPSDASLVTAGEGVAAVVPVPADPAMAGFRPRPRPEGLVPEPAPEDDARLATEAASAVATLRPLPRPATVLAAARTLRPAEGPAVADLGAQGASLAAQAEAQLAAATALEAQNPSIVAISMRPASRPRDLSRAVEAAVAAAVRAPEPEAEVIETAAAPPPELKPEELDELDEPEAASAAPSIPTRASVAKQATFANAINLSKINLIGTYGTDSRRYALIRQSNGRYKKVKVGDKIDGGIIKAITETEVRYQKGGKLIALTMPKA